jgi:adenosylhomocysteine nucleosidase
MKPAGLLFLLVLVWPVLRAENAEALLAAGSDAELKPLLAQMTGVRIERHAAWTFWLGQLGGRKVVLTRTDGDPLNAVAATTLALRHYSPRLVVTFGAARAHDPALHAGDIVVATRFAAFDGMVSPVTPLDGGSNALKWVALPHLLMVRGGRAEPVMNFAADATAAAMAREVAARQGHAIEGVLGSANQVNREADRVAFLRTQWGTSCEDGDSADVAGCAQLLGVPVVGWCVIDGADGAAAALVPPFLEAWK